MEQTKERLEGIRSIRQSTLSERDGTYANGSSASPEQERTANE